MRPTAKFRIEGEDASSAAFRAALGNAQSTATRMAGMFKVAFAGISVASVGALAARAIETGDTLSKMAYKAGIGGKAISELAHAAQMADVDMDSLSTSLRFMQKAISEAGTGLQTPLRAFEALGIKLEQIKGMQADKQFELIAQRLSELKDPADRSRAATELLGRAGADLLPMFEQGAAGIRKAREEARLLGKSFSDEQIKALADADAAVKRLKGSWDALNTSFWATKAMQLSETMNALTASLLGGDALTEYELQVARENLERAKASGADVEAIARIQARIAEHEKKLGLGAPSYNRRGRKAPGVLDSVSGLAKGYGTSEDEITEVIVTAQKIRTASMEAFYNDLDERTQTSLERQLANAAQMQSALDVLYDNGRIGPDVYNARMKEMLDDLLPEVEVTAQKIGDALSKPVIEMPERVQRMADMARWSMEEFFFDPVHHGIKGLGRDLVNTLRQSIAEGLADKLFTSKASGGFGWGDAIAGFGKTLLGFADGGYTHGRDPIIVGERGPEIFHPGGPGRIVPNHALAGGPSIVINQHIDARGATMELAAALPGILKTHGEQTELRIVQRLRRNYYG